MTALRIVVIGALIALVAACQTAYAPPMPRELSDAVDGARVRLAPGQDLIVNLDGNLTTGFRWFLNRSAEPQLRFSRPFLGSGESKVAWRTAWKQAV